MKLCYFDDFKLGVVKGDAVVDVSVVINDIPHIGPGDLMNGLIASFASYRPKIEDAVVKGTGVPLNSVKILPPLPAPKTIDCMAVNYMEDGTNGTRSAPAPINAFHKSPSTCGDIRWSCPTCRRQSSRVRPRWPSSSASAPAMSAKPTQ